MCGKIGLLGGGILSKLKNREEFEGGLKKLEDFEETSNKNPKNREEFRQAGEQFFWLARIYTPALDITYVDIFVPVRKS